MRGGAHNFGGTTAGDGGLTVDLSTVCQVLVDPAARTARGQPTLSRSARHCPPVTCRDTAGAPGAGTVTSAEHAYQIRHIRVFVLGVVVMAKYLLLFSFTGDTVRGFVARPSDRAAVVRGLAESVGGGLESYYWMFGQYDGAGVVEMPDSHTMAAVSLAAAGSGAFTHLETHELIEAGDLARIAERARQIAYQPPGA